MPKDRMLHWRGPDPEHIDMAYVRLDTDSLMAHGASLTSSYALDFRLATGPGWVTRELDVRTRGDHWWRSLVLRRSEDGDWTADWSGQGSAQLPRPLPDVHALPQALPDLRASLDCDLGLCPLTNTMPIRRHDLVGAAHRGESRSHDFLMALVAVPDLAVHGSRQRYAVSDPIAAGGGALVGFVSGEFSTTLEADADGLLVSYPGLARRVESFA